MPAISLGAVLTASALSGLFGLVTGLAVGDATENVARAFKWAAVGGAVYVAGKALRVI